MKIVGVDAESALLKVENLELEMMQTVCFSGKNGKQGWSGLENWNDEVDGLMIIFARCRKILAWSQEAVGLILGRCCQGEETLEVEMVGIGNLLKRVC